MRIKRYLLLAPIIFAALLAVLAAGYFYEEDRALGELQSAQKEQSLLRDTMLALVNEQAPIARLPMLKNFAALASDKKDGATLDEEWFSKTASLLNLPAKHFAAYLNILIKAIKERAIALENAASAQDRLIIIKTTSF